jgi:hypothetical protein
MRGPSNPRTTKINDEKLAFLFPFLAIRRLGGSSVLVLLASTIEGPWRNELLNLMTLVRINNYFHRVFYLLSTEIYYVLRANGTQGMLEVVEDRVICCFLGK